MHQRDRGALAVGAGDRDHPVRRQIGAGAREQLDIADQRHPEGSRPLGDRVGVERHAGGDHQRVQPGHVRLHRVGDRRTAFQRRARLLLPVPGQHLGPARQQRLGRSQPAARKTEHAVALAGEGGGDDHRSFNVARPISASTIEMIQKRTTTVDSDQPSCSK